MGGDTIERKEDDYATDTRPQAQGPPSEGNKWKGYTNSPSEKKKEDLTQYGVTS